MDETDTRVACRLNKTLFSRGGGRGEGVGEGVGVGGGGERTVLQIKTLLV